MKNSLKKRLQQFLFNCGDYLALKLTGSRVSNLYSIIKVLHNKAYSLDCALSGTEYDLIVVRDNLRESEDAKKSVEYDLHALKRAVIYTQTTTEDLIKLAKTVHSKLGFSFYEFLCEQHSHVRDVFSKAAESQISFCQFESYCDSIMSRSDATGFLWDIIVALKCKE